MLKALSNSLLSIVYPQTCSSCGGHVDARSDGVACDRCWRSTRIFTSQENLCSKCGAFHQTGSSTTSIRCHRCDQHEYDRALAVGVYEKALSASILELKRTPWIPRRLNDLIASRLVGSLLEEVDVIIPTPLSKLRMIERGFNQAQMIALAVSKVIQKPVDAHTLTREVHTPIHRIGMDQRARELTVQKAFLINRPKFISDKHVLMVDDVFTSGSTASAMASALKKNGARRVDVFTLARAVLR